MQVMQGTNADFVKNIALVNQHSRRDLVVNFPLSSSMLPSHVFTNHFLKIGCDEFKIHSVHRLQRLTSKQPRTSSFGGPRQNGEIMLW
jgi:hypothetical protein